MSNDEFQTMLKSYFCCCQVISEYQRQKVSKRIKSIQKEKDSKDEHETSAKNTAWHHQIRVQTEHGVAADTK